MLTGENRYMKDTKIMGCAVACIVVGFIALHATVSESREGCVPISSLTLEQAYASCEGIVSNIHRTHGHTFVQIYDGDFLDVPFFNAEIAITVGDVLSVTGKISEYHGRIQIIPEKYTVIPVTYGVCTDTHCDTGLSDHAPELSPGFHALVADAAPGEDICKKELFFPFIEVSGVITSSYPKNDSYCSVLYSGLRLYHEPSLESGQITGYGIPTDEGIVLLWYRWIDLEAESISSAVTHPLGYPVKVCGTIISQRISHGHIFVIIEDATGCISIPIFADQQLLLGITAESLIPGQIVTVKGILSQYRGTQEIIPSVIS